ncbi:hypothetical protein [Pseudoduganella sp. UC29_71]|uniref:hypothetical protein n=1 Tax=Pseudoduganella sp. UC29_71 TaxID=3350174 RepID=UPI00366F2051
MPLPVGLTYHPNGSVVLDPDQAIRAVLQLLFDTRKYFRLVGSAGNECGDKPGRIYSQWHAGKPVERVMA